MNGSSTQPSVCSYNGSFAIAIETGYKDPLRNSLTLTYDLGPLTPLLALNNGSTDFRSLVSFPLNAGVTVTSAVVDPATGKLVVTLDYSQNLQDTELQLHITPPNVPQASLVPEIVHSWTVLTTNQLAAVIYSPEDYATNARVRSLADGLLYSALAVVFLTMAYRKFIGLELASLIQLGYLSVLMNRRVSTYL